jgi:hypothetical protein
MAGAVAMVRTEAAVLVRNLARLHFVKISLSTAALQRNTRRSATRIIRAEKEVFVWGEDPPKL